MKWSWRNSWRSPVIWTGLIFLCVILFIVIYFSVQGSKEADPGVAWKVPYEAYPELKDIYENYKSTCVIPAIPKKFFDDTQANTTYQQMREDCKRLPDTEKYEAFETKKWTLTWAQRIKSFSDGVNLPEYDIPVGAQGAGEYKLRIGCYHREISDEMESYTSQKIQALMTRLGLPNKLDHLTDSRGGTYMPPGGFMEYHSNQNHQGGWRLYMHYLPEGGESWFAYQHPFDGSYRRIADTNEGANMFRVRKPPKNLLWHSIYSDTPRFSWGIWLPPELAQHLKTYGERI